MAVGTIQSLPRDVGQYNRGRRTGLVYSDLSRHIVLQRTLLYSPQGIAKQLVRALHYLHSNRIIHRCGGICVCMVWGG